jgi:glycosyltransferase involved in cell wall biosynthesis
MTHTKILILYSELASYTIACLEKLANMGVELHVIRYPVNKEAPFIFNDNDEIKFYDRNSLNNKGLEKLVSDLAPSLIICSGWIDKEYVAVCRKYAGKIRTVLALDNKWTGSFKQQLASLAGRFSVIRYFDMAWVPGMQQAKYARKLGFQEKDIHTGFYSCDHSYFANLYSEMKGEKEKSFPHRFIFSGRYYDFKGVQELWKAFAELKSEFPNDWELWCMGTGTATPFQHPAIKHFGFIQPRDISKFMKDTGVFVMPSRFEPWGVVLHEFTAAGFPVICSDQVGAKEAFLSEGKNGFSFPAGNKEILKSVMRKMITLPDKELNAMGAASSQLAKKITPSTWTQTVFKMMA